MATAAAIRTTITRAARPLDESLTVHSPATNAMMIGVWPGLRNNAVGGITQTRLIWARGRNDLVVDIPAVGWQLIVHLDATGSVRLASQR